MKKFYTLVLAFVAAIAGMNAQQLPDSHFENWSESFNGDAQLKDWHGSNVEQLGFKFTFMFQKTGRSGYCAYVADREIGALGITEEAPGYMGLGISWQYMEGASTGTATAGMYGGMSWKYRPDTMAVWIKRTGSNTDKEDFHLMYYAWSGTAKGSKYKCKNGGCTSTSRTNEESDVRQALDGNECGTDTKANQIAEGWYRARAKYDAWTQIKVPIYYMNSDVPSMCNVIFSASNYPNFRANSGLYAGNDLYVDDVELIYSSKIQKLYIDNKEWKGFDSDSEEEQTYSLGEKATTLPAIEAWRGAGKLTNVRGTTATFNGRKLSGSEITITNGTIDGTPTTITVKSEDGKSTHVYKIKFVRAPSTNANLAGVLVNGEELAGFKGATTTYNVELPYGTKKAPVIEAVKAEDQQTVSITQATSTNGTATINVTAADKKTTKKYTFSFSVAPLSDNRLKGILVNGTEVAGFNPTLSIYKVSLPLGTTTMPKVDTLSFYPAGEQTVVHTKPDKIDGGTYQIAVSSPGNQTPKIYKLTFKLEASSYSKLKSLQLGGMITDFDPNLLIYYVNLPLGTTSLPKVEYVLGDPYQTVKVDEGGLNGTTRVTVTAGNGDQTVYKIVVSTMQSDVSKLNMIYLDGKPLEGFNENKLSYDVELQGVTTLPVITVDKGDEYETYNILSGGLNGTTRISVSAQDGSSTIYQINFSVKLSTNNSLEMIYLTFNNDGKDSTIQLPNFDPDVLEYTHNLKKGETVPNVTWDAGDEYQTIVPRPGSNEYKITVRPQSGASKTYKITFDVKKSDNTTLKMIYVNNKPIENYGPENREYTYTLNPGETPKITYDKQETTQKVLIVDDGDQQQVIVTAESGAKGTYIITFGTQKNENAFLSMIYLTFDNNGKDSTIQLPGFRPDSIVYRDTLPNGSTSAPRITVDEEPGQQVTIVSPVCYGTAKILVQPEGGDVPTPYTIEFVAKSAPSAELEKVFLNGKEFEEFKPSKQAYTIETKVQKVTCQTKFPEQKVDTLISQNVVRLFVTNGTAQNVYTFTFTNPQSTVATVDSVFFNGVKYDAFKPDQANYVITLAAGEAIPVITFFKSANAKESYFGQVAEREWEIKVMPEQGDENTYHFTFQNEKFGDATLANLELSNGLLTYKANQKDYTVEIERGAQLPDVIITTKPGQTTLLTQPDSEHQQIVVTAEDGTTKTYTIAYTRKLSVNTQLANIFVDGVQLAGFAPDIYNYIDSLAWRTRVVPNVQPIAQVSTQIVTTYYCAVNGTMQINVVAESGAEGNYYIEFPVRKSSNVELGSLYLGSDDAELEYKPSQTDYEIELPFESTAAPMVIYTKAEPEQTVEFIARPLGETSQIIVTAENGDQRTYNILFKREVLKTKNLLASLSIVESNEILDVKTDKTKRDFEVTMPYGSRTLTIEYEKMYKEQTVFVKPGGVNHPTIITVKANNGDVADEVYTITPTVQTQNPAVLESITINGTPLEGFDKNRFSYIVNIDDTEGAAPIVEPAGYDGALPTPTITSTKHWQCVVSKNGQQCTYDLWFYYTKDVVPNADFTQWTTAANNAAPKPTDWNCIADYFDKFDAPASGTHKFGANGEVAEVTVSGSNKAVQLNSKKSAGNTLSTLYGGALGGILPAWITLGTITGNLQVAAGSTFAAQGGIRFRNTPDVMLVRAKTGSVSGSNRIVYQLSGSGNKELVFSTEANTGYKEYSYDLAPANNLVTAPTQLNIILNSMYKESVSTLTDGSEAEMTVDYVHFTFNNALSALKVDALNATKSGNSFAVTLTDPERVEIPTLTFTGEVPDQAQKVVWTAESKNGEYGVRTATIINYGEDSKTANYVLEVKRPLDQRSILSAIKIGGVEWNKFAAETNEYEYHLKSSQTQLPDFEAVPASSLQTINVTFKDSTMTIVVTPEYGSTRTYKVKFITDLSDDVTLKSLSHVTDFDKDTKQYTLNATSFPIFTFEKQSDRQIVDIKNGNIAVTAENGAKGTYIVKLAENDDPTSAQLKEFVFDGKDIAGFGEGNYEKTQTEHPVLTSFKRVSEPDSVIYTQSATGMTWNVLGNKAEHTYKLLYPVELSDDANLQTILVDGKPLAGFAVGDYTVYTDTAVAIQPVGKEGLNQKITVTPNNNQYTIVVTSEDGLHTNTYEVQVKPTQTNIATLASIKLDGVEIPGFRPDSLTYEITLPTPSAKLEEPQMPELTYEVADTKQKVELELGELNGDATKLLVTAADGITKQEYSVTIKSEPSHNAFLTGIMVNGTPVEEFEVGRHNYSANSETDAIEIIVASEDNFQKVEIKSTRLADNVERDSVIVTAQDGKTTEIYVVKVYVQRLSNDAELADILLDGKSFNHFDDGKLEKLNPDLTFNPRKFDYTIKLESGTTATPKISAKLKADGQTVAIRQTGMKVELEVTAEDGTTNTYELDFQTPKSKYDKLSMIMIGTDPIDKYTKFTPEKTYYHISLPVGVHDSVDIRGQKGHSKQTLTSPQQIHTDEGWEAKINVRPEDPEANSTVYTVVYDYTRSDVDSLAVIYVNGDTIPGFEGNKLAYNITLPAGSTDFWTLEAEKGDEWQQEPRIDTIRYNDDTRITYKITATAENDQSRVYIVNYEIAKSDVDTLMMIYVDNKTLPNFNSRVYDYYVTLDATATALPEVYGAKGDMFQTLGYAEEEEFVTTELPDSVKAVNHKIEIHVHAQNGNTRVYTVHFSMKKSDDATLGNILVNGNPLSGFDAETPFYRGTPLSCMESVPVVTFIKGHEGQTGDITILPGEAADTVQIHVTAEDGKTTETYRVVFEPQESDNFFLSNIVFNDGYHIQFDSLQSEYTLEIPFGVDTVPTMTPIASDVCQTIVVDSVQRIDSVTARQTVTVYPYNNNIENIYTITYIFRRKGDATLKSIMINGEPLHDFKPEVTDYNIVFPSGMDSTDYYTPQNVTYILSDSLASDTIWMDETFTILIEVKAQDGSRNTYSLHQSTGESDDNWLKDILLDGVSIRDFDPEVLFYTYYVGAGKTAPEVQAIPHDPKAEVSIKPAENIGDTTLIMCTAENNETRVYQLLFTYTTIDDAQTPSPRDVLLKRLFGSTDILVASLRSNVQFYLFDRNGRMVELVEMIPVCDQNDAIIKVDANGREVLNDVVNESAGVRITLNPNTLYFYTFFEDNKRRIASGKLVIVNDAKPAQ